MAIRFRCHNCDQLMSIAGRMAGQTVPCPSCQTGLTVPEEDAVPMPRPHSLHEISTARQADFDVEDDEEAFVIRQAETEFEEMDLTPMVDVTFLLLIFFMITASFSLQKSIEVPIPDPDKQGATQSIQTLDDLQETSVIVEIDAENRIYIDDVPLADPSMLIDKLQEKIRIEQKSELVLSADAQAFYETVVAVYDAGIDVGMQRIRMTTTAGSSLD